MGLILLSLFLGFLAGWKIHPDKKKIRTVSRGIDATVSVLIFFLGVQTGSNPDILNNLSRFGGLAILFSIAGILGSIVVFKGLSKWIESR